MTNVKNQTQPTQGGINPVVAAVTGAVFGAGVAVAGAVALSNDQNRQKINDAVDNVKGKVEDTKSQVLEKKEEVKKDLIKGVKKL